MELMIVLFWLGVLAYIAFVSKETMQMTLLSMWGLMLASTLFSFVAFLFS